MTDPNAKQIGGTHYRATNATMQHWDLMALINANYFVGYSTKYLARFPLKNGVQDLEKCKHVLEKYASLSSPEYRKWRHEQLGVDHPMRVLHQKNYFDFYRRQIERWVISVCNDLSHLLHGEELAALEDAFNAIFQGVPNMAIEYVDKLIDSQTHDTGEPTSAYTNQ